MVVKCVCLYARMKVSLYDCTRVGVCVCVLAWSPDCMIVRVCMCVCMCVVVWVCACMCVYVHLCVRVSP